MLKSSNCILNYSWRSNTRCKSATHSQSKGLTGIFLNWGVSTHFLSSDDRRGTRGSMIIKRNNRISKGSPRTLLFIQGLPCIYYSIKAKTLSASTWIINTVIINTGTTQARLRWLEARCPHAVSTGICSTATLHLVETTCGARWGKEQMGFQFLTFPYVQYQQHFALLGKAKLQFIVCLLIGILNGGGKKFKQHLDFWQWKKKKSAVPCCLSCPNIMAPV